MVKPAKLLQNLGMLWVAVKDTSVRGFGALELLALDRVSQSRPDHLRLSAAHEHDQSGTKYPPH